MELKEPKAAPEPGPCASDGEKEVLLDEEFTLSGGSCCDDGTEQDP